MSYPRIIFMGTPEFAATILQGLIDASYNVVGLVSQPDRPVGRKRIIEPTPTKKVALKYNIPVCQEEKIKKDYSFIENLKPDLIVTCAYGQIVPQGLLDIPPLGCINVHASLLPKHRGGAPIHRAIINGDKETGVTIMEMIDKMDAGRMYAKKSIPILDSDNLETMFNKLQIVGRDLLLEVLPSYIDGKLIGEVQNEEEVTFAWNIKHEEEEINWNKTSREIFNHIRGLYPSPATYTYLDGEVVKVFVSEIVDETSEFEVGTIVNTKKGITVACKKGLLKIKELQVSGKKRMDAASFLNGAKIDLVGKKLGKKDDYNFTTLENKAYLIAKEAHMNQVDKGGKDYIYHPLFVASNCKSENERIVALLHDVVEDTSVTLNDLKETFSDEIIKAIDCITHYEYLSNQEYLDRVKSNPIAKAVKIQDIKHNMDFSRLKNIDDNTKQRLKEKYTFALEYLIK